MPAGDLEWIQDYVWRGGQLLATVNPTGAPREWHYTLNHLGSPVLVTYHDGTELGTWDHAPFGEDMSPAGNPPVSEGFPLRFTGHERDFHGVGVLDDLDYMHARHYTPYVGRFLQIDQVLGNLGSPQSWNRYAYAANDPVNFYDPDGRVTTVVGLGGAWVRGAGGEGSIALATDWRYSSAVLFSEGPSAGWNFSGDFFVGFMHGDTQHQEGFTQSVSVSLFGATVTVYSSGHRSFEGITFGLGPGVGVSWAGIETEILWSQSHVPGDSSSGFGVISDETTWAMCGTDPETGNGGHRCEGSGTRTIVVGQTSGREGFSGGLPSLHNAPLDIEYTWKEQLAIERFEEFASGRFWDLIHGPSFWGGGGGGSFCPASCDRQAF